MRKNLKILFLHRSYVCREVMFKELFCWVGGFSCRLNVLCKCFKRQDGFGRRTVFYCTFFFKCIQIFGLDPDRILIQQQPWSGSDQNSTTAMIRIGSEFSNSLNPDRNRVQRDTWIRTVFIESGSEALGESTWITTSNKHLYVFGRCQCWWCVTPASWPSRSARSTRGSPSSWPTSR